MQHQQVTLRLAVVRDYRAEGWPSMDLCADQLLTHLPLNVRSLDIDLSFRPLFGSLPIPRVMAFNADRLLNRHLLLARLVRRLCRDADFIHIADHSYAHLALSLPANQVGVYCHDLDAFRCLIQPQVDRRPWWFRMLALRTLAGMRRAAIVFHNSIEVGRQLVSHGLVRPNRLVHAPLGVAEEFVPNGENQTIAGVRMPYLLHVGGDMPRKRLDVLLEVFSVLRQRHPDLRLVQVGPPWSTERLRQLRNLKLVDSIVKLTGISRVELSSLYRSAAVVLVPSETEGFGLPVIEALACGAIVVASDIPVLREVGGEVIFYAPVANVRAWVDLVSGIYTRVETIPPMNDRMLWVSRYSWVNHSNTIADAYYRLENIHNTNRQRSDN